MLSEFRRAATSLVPRPVANELKYWRDAGQRLPFFRLYSSLTKGRCGLEIGGPSSLFRTSLPLYRGARKLDGVNFATRTVWEGHLQRGNNFSYYGNRKGFQFICEATDLKGVASGAYGFVLSSNCLEHVANPIKALLEWKRVMRPGAALVLVLPNKRSNFDHNRAVTPFAHLLEDWQADRTEADLTHLDEILACHDLLMDPPAGTLEQFKQRSLDNLNNRTLHHHVFDLCTMAQMLTHCGFEVHDLSETPADLFALAVRKG